MNLYHLPKLNQVAECIPELMSEEQLMAHYGRHHKTYITKTNELIQDGSLDLGGSMLCYLSKKTGTGYMSDSVTGPIFNNVAQTWNHTFFWVSLGLIDFEKLYEDHVVNSSGQRTESDRAVKLLEESKDSLKKEYLEASKKLFGSGYVWLMWDRKDHFYIQQTSNAQPALHTQSMPLLAVDLWEHSYYLNYTSERLKYAEKVWEHLNWRWAETLIRDPGLLQRVEDLMKSQQ